MAIKATGTLKRGYVALECEYSGRITVLGLPIPIRLSWRLVSTRTNQEEQLGTMLGRLVKTSADAWLSYRSSYGQACRSVATQLRDQGAADLMSTRTCHKRNRHIHPQCSSTQRNARSAFDTDAWGERITGRSALVTTRHLRSLLTPSGKDFA